jgi:hypothetical protein
MTALCELRCDCGADLFVSGDMYYVGGEASRFNRLHKGDGHFIRNILDAGDRRGRDNLTEWWKSPRKEKVSD